MKQLFDKKELPILILGFILISTILAVSTYVKIGELAELRNEILTVPTSIPNSISKPVSVFSTVTASDLKAKIEGNEDFVLVDARGAKDFNEAHIERAISTPLADIVEKSKDLSKEKLLVVMCYSSGCQSADKAAAKFSELGFTNITIFREGMEGWTEAGYPTVSGG